MTTSQFLIEGGWVPLGFAALIVAALVWELFRGRGRKP